MSSKFLTILSVCVILSCTVHAADKDMVASGTKIKIKGRSGKMEVSRDMNTTDPNRVTVEMDELKEVDTGNNAVGTTGNQKHSFNSFASQDFTFGTLQQVQYQNLSAVKIDFTATLVGSANFKTSTYLFKDAGKVMSSDEASVVKKGSMKFCITIDNWPWCTGDNCKKGQTKQYGSYIDFVITMKGKKTPTKKGSGETTPYSGSSYSSSSTSSTTSSSSSSPSSDTLDYDLGGMIFALSRRVKVDGVWQNMPTGYPKYERQGSKDSFTFRFPKGNGTGSALFYDPTITSEPESSSTPAPTPTVTSSSGSTTPTTSGSAISPTTPTPTPIPAAAPAPAPTRKLTTIKQSVTFANLASAADYTGAVKTIYELAYANANGLTTVDVTTDKIKLTDGVKVTSSATRRAAKVTFESEIGAAFKGTVPTSTSTASAAAIATAVSTVVTKNKVQGVSVPKAADITVAKPTVATKTTVVSAATPQAALSLLMVATAATVMISMA